MKQPICISLCNIKGGVGKSTVAFNMAGVFAHNGYKTLLIDNDPQGNLTDFTRVTNDFKLYDLYNSPKVKVTDCITKYNENIDIIVTDIESAILEKELNSRMVGEATLKGKISKYDLEKYDFILMDCSPFLGQMTVNALTISDYYIVVVDNSVSALKGVKLVNNLSEEIKRSALNFDLKCLGILRNNFSKNTIFSKNIHEVVENNYKETFKTVIPTSIKFKEASTKSITIDKYDKKLLKVYQELFEEIKNRISEDITNGK